MNTKDLIELYNIINNDLDRLWGFYEFTIKNVEDMRRALESINEDYKTTSAEVIEKLYYHYVNSEPSQQYLTRIFDEMQQGMAPEEKAPMILELMDNNVFMDIQKILSKEDKFALLDKIDTVDEEKRSKYMYYTVADIDVFDYINENGKNKDILVDEAIKKYGHNLNKIAAIALYLDDEYYKALICISKKIKPTEVITEIKDDYIRSRIILNKDYIDSFGFDKSQDFIDLLKEYQASKKILEQLETEEEKTGFICSLKDNDMKMEFLKSIQKKDNRDKIIGSLENSIDSDLQAEVTLVQKMITEYFEDTLGENFTQDKRERMQMTFKISDVYFNNTLPSNVNGRAYAYHNIININSRLKGNSKRIVPCLIHENGHLFSNFSSKETEYVNGGSLQIEEGTQDLLEEKVINHYLEKHGRVELNGRDLRLDYPYISSSAYSKEAGWQRTMLYPLKESRNR